MSTGKKEKTYKGVGRKMAEMEKDIELRKKEGRYFTMQANSFDGEDLGNLVGEGLTYPDGLLLYCRSGNIEIYLKYRIGKYRHESNFYIEEKIDNKLTKEIDLDKISYIKTTPGGSSERKFDKYPIDIIFNKESYPYIFLLFKHDLQEDRSELYSSNDDISLLMINIEKEDKKKTYRAYDYQSIKLVTSNESINFDSTYKGTQKRYLKDLRTNVLKLHNNGKLLMIQTQNGNRIFYHLITLLDNKPGKIRGKYMFYDRNLFNEFSIGDELKVKFNKDGNWSDKVTSVDYLILGYNFLNTYIYKEYGSNEKMENIEKDDIKFLVGDILNNYYDFSDHDPEKSRSDLYYKLGVKIPSLFNFLNKGKDDKKEYKNLSTEEVLSHYSEPESKKKKKCEMIFGIISIDNLGYYRVFKNIKLTFYDLYTYNADSKKYDRIFTFIKKDLQDIIDVEEPLYSYLSTSIDHEEGRYSYLPKSIDDKEKDSKGLKKTSAKGDIINIDIGRTEKSKISNIIYDALPPVDRRDNNEFNYRLENINIESNFDDTIIVFNPIFKYSRDKKGPRNKGNGVLLAKFNILTDLRGLNSDEWDYVYKIFQKVYSPKIVVTNLDSSITKIDFHNDDSAYFSLNYSNDNDLGILEGNRILTLSRKNKDFLENLDKRKGCEISENQGFKYYYTNTGKNALDYLVIAGNYLINLRIKVVRETPEDQRNMNISIFKKGIDKDGKGDVMFHQIKCYNMELSENMKNSINDFKITEDLDINLMFLKKRDDRYDADNTNLYKLDFKTNIDMDTAFDELSDLYKMNEKGNFGKYADGSVFKLNEPKKEEGIELKKYTSNDLQGIEKRLSKQKKQIVEKSNAEMRAKENAIRLKKGLLRNTEKEVAQLKKEKEEKIKKQNALKDDIKKLRTRSPKGQIGRRTYIGKKTIPQLQDKKEVLSDKQILEKDNSRIKKVIMKFEKMKGTSTLDEDKIKKLKSDIKDLESAVKYSERQIKYELDKVKLGKEPRDTKFYVSWIKQRLPELNDMPTETNEDLMNFYERSLQVSSSKLRNLEYDIMDEEAKDEEERKKIIDKLKEQGEYLDSRIKEYYDKQLEDKMDFSEADPEGAKKYREKKKEERELAELNKERDSLEKKKAAAEVKKRRTQRKAATKIQTQQRRYSAKKKLKTLQDERSYLNLLTQVTPLKSTPERAAEELEEKLKLKKGIEERVANKETKKSKSKKKTEQIKKLKRTLKNTLKELESLQSDDSSSGSQSSSLSSVDSDKL